MPPDNSQTQLNDQEIQFKKRARRRLVGAIALVLIMVAVLPMVLDDHAAKAPPQEIAISIPSQDGGEFTSKIVPVTPVAETPVVEAAPVVAPEPTPPVVHESSQKPASIKLESVAVPVETPKAEPVKQPPVKAQPAKTEAPKKEIAKSSDKIAEDKKPADPKVASGNAYVQIGVFSDEENVKQLQQKLSSLSLKSYTEKIDTPKGQKIRLRAGPFSSRQNAETALEKVKGAGLTGMVVSK